MTRREKQKAYQNHEAAAIQRYNIIMAQREAILTGFIAEFGCKPSEIEQIERTLINGDRQWFLRKREEKKSKISIFKR